MAAITRDVTSSFRRACTIPARALDLLGEARRGATGIDAGREFGRDVLAAAWTAARIRLPADRRLSGGIHLSGQRQDARRYLFKHALIQDAAYESMLKSSRVAHHRRIAEVLESQFAGIVAEAPEVVAHHYAAGRVPERACNSGSTPAASRCAQRARGSGRAPAQRARRAERAARGPERSLAELDVQITLGTRWSPQGLRVAGRRSHVDARAAAVRDRRRRAAAVPGAVRAVDVRVRARQSSERRSNCAPTYCAGQKPCKATTC